MGEVTSRIEVKTFVCGIPDRSQDANAPTPTGDGWVLHSAIPSAYHTSYGMGGIITYTYTRLVPESKETAKSFTVCVPRETLAMLNVFRKPGLAEHVGIDNGPTSDAVTLTAKTPYGELLLRLFTCHDIKRFVDAVKWLHQ